MAYTSIDDPSAYFQAALYTGNGSTQNITNDGNSDLKPDLVWTKARSDTSHHTNVDSSRGAGKQIYPNLTAAEETVSGVSGFLTDGFSLGSNGTANANTITHVAWQWKANGGTTSSNTEGNVTNTLQVNQDAGFSISKFTSISSGNTTIGHGLGVAPACFITKLASGTSGWWVNHKGLTNQSDKYLGLNVTLGEGTVSWGAAPTSTLITMAPAFIGNGTTTVMCYAFAEKQGYSKFGKYTGNGSTDGPFVYTGFKPAFLMMKESSSAGGNWVMFDNKRDPSNVTKTRLFPNLTNADNTTRNYVDLLSNGFKLRDTDADHNQNGQTMIYMAFAENPFVTSTGIPTTAR
jgi:hypothetical protein